MQRKIVALIGKLKAHPDDFERIRDRIRRDDPQLMQLFMQLMRQS